MQTRTTIGWLTATALVVAGCGNTARYANQPPQALPVNLTVYISPSRVSVSPASVGAGPVVVEVTNQSNQAESLSVAPAAGGGTLASTGPINPQATAQVALNVARGEYEISTATGGSDAAQSQPHAIAPARVQVGAPRPGSRGVLLTP